MGKVQYALSGLLKRIYCSPVCPCCGGAGITRDVKFPFRLKECSLCGIMYRTPGESGKQMDFFYQEDYKQAGLTTDFPSKPVLKELLEKRFEGTEKDFSKIIRLFQYLEVPQGVRILDYGANWGYSVYQLNHAGYRACGYEISESRSKFSRELGVDVTCDWDSIGGQFDVVFSSHVLEHMPDPINGLRLQATKVKNGGLLIGLTPNGELDRLNHDPVGYHLNWGQAHPFLLTKKSVVSVFKQNKIAFSDNLEGLAQSWNAGNIPPRPLTGSELCFIAKL